ncbi:MAG: TonB-dependent receptor [Ahniella sp.]|nr:TonB-dependent receptor [Ahniella sp.]
MLVGAFYYDDNTNVPEVNFLQQASASYQSFETTTKSGALFGRLTYEVKPELRLTLGARETWEKSPLPGTCSR